MDIPSVNAPDERPTVRHTRSDGDSIRPDQPAERVRFLEEELHRRERELNRVIEQYESLLAEVREERSNQSAETQPGSEHMFVDIGRSIVTFGGD